MRQVFFVIGSLVGLVPLYWHIKTVVPILTKVVKRQLKVNIAVTTLLLSTIAAVIGRTAYLCGACVRGPLGSLLAASSPLHHYSPLCASSARRSVTVIMAGYIITALLIDFEMSFERYMFG